MDVNAHWSALYKQTNIPRRPSKEQREPRKLTTLQLHPCSGHYEEIIALSTRMPHMENKAKMDANEPHPISAQSIISLQPFKVTLQHERYPEGPAGCNNGIIGSKRSTVPLIRQTKSRNPSARDTQTRPFQ